MRPAQVFAFSTATRQKKLTRALCGLSVVFGVLASIARCVAMGDVAWSNEVLDTRLLETNEVSTSQNAYSTLQEEDLLRLQTIADGETVDFKTRYLPLNSTIHIQAWNIEIRGAAGGTTVNCPPRVPGLVIQSSNVTLVNLSFEECKGSGAIKADGMYVSPQKDSQAFLNNDIRKRRTECSIEMFMRGCNFSSNEAQYGAAVFLNEGCLNVSDTMFGLSSATYGGSLVLSNANVVIADSMFLNNTAEFGGAVFAENSTLNVTRTNFRNNSAEHYGGALFLDGHSPLILKECTFEDNSADGGGGCIRAHKSDVNISSSKFSNNTALRGGAAFVEIGSYVRVDASTFEMHHATMGGVFYASKSTTLIESSHFRNNSATDGAVVHSVNSTISINQSTFEKNRAEQKGGAVLIQDQSQLSLMDSTFENNTARLGGCGYAVASSITVANATFKSNNAATGGALHLCKNARLRTAGDLLSSIYFKLNEARHGGGIYCDACRVQLDHPVKFGQNVADGNGGAAYLVNARNDSRISIAAFDQNVAMTGGALAIKNCRRFKLGNLSKGQTNFSSNFATNGGAPHVVLHSDHDETFEIRNCKLEFNRALKNKAALQKAAKSLAGQTWRARKREPFANADHMQRGLTDTRGRGGGLYFALHNLEPTSHVILKIAKVTIQQNAAELGGGGYFENDVKDFEWRYADNCSAACDGANRCRCYEAGDVLITENNASAAGGGVFTASPKNLAFCSESLVREPTGDLACGAVRNNRLSAGSDGYGSNIASDATLLELNVTGPLSNLTHGDKLAVPCSRDNQVSCRPTEITVTVKDIFNQTIVGGCKDSELSILLESDMISGKRNYTVHRGEVTIDSTFVAGVDEKDVELVFRPDDERDFFASLNFSIRPCGKGELPIGEEKRCVRCPRFSYTLEASEDGCKDCEDHAVCDGTAALVPEEGYWHCGPFSPFMIRCLHEDACTFKSRTEKLIEFYGNGTHVLELLEWLKENDCTALEAQDSTECVDLGNYKQCADGYEGPVCGSCASGYGHNADGSCSMCNLKKRTSRGLTALFALVLFGVVTVKLVLILNDMKTQAVFERKEQRRDTVIRLAQEHALQSGPESSRRRVTNGATSEPTSLQQSPSTQESQQFSETAEEAQLLLHQQSSDSVPPTSLERTEPVRNPERSEVGLNDVSSGVMKASTALSDTFNILFNYVQLNTVALTADVAWKGAMKNWLSIQAALGRAFNVKILPFDCSFSTSKKTGVIPKSLLTLWYRTAFPIATMSLYLFFIAVRRQLTDEEFRHDVFNLPSAASVVLIVYLSFSIDVFANLLRVLHCKSVNSADHRQDQFTSCDSVPQGSLWTGDTEVPCWKGAHLWSAVAAVVGLAGSIAVLVLILKVVRYGKSRHKLRKPKFIMEYGFLYLAYRQEGLALYWEAIITLRKMLLATVGEFGKYKEMSGAQIGQSAMIILAFLLLHEITKPFNYVSLRNNFPSYAGSTLRRQLCISPKLRFDDWQIHDDISPKNHFDELKITDSPLNES